LESGALPARTECPVPHGAPLLDSHSAYSVADQLGAVVPGSASLFKKAATVKVRFSKRDAVEPVWQDVRDGLIRSVSVGYRVYRFEETAGKDNKLPVRTAIDWEPFEVSMVPIPADPGAKTRGGEPTDSNECEIVTRAGVEPVEAVKPKSPEQEQPPTVQGAQEEPKMTDKDRSETIVEQNPLLAAMPPPKQTAEPSERDAGADAERERMLTIMEACTGNRLPISFARKLIADKVPLVRAQTLILEELAKRDGDAPRGPSQRPEIMGEDPLVHARAGIVNAILHRIAPDRHQLEDIGRPYRGMSLLDIGRALLSARGVRVTAMSRSDLADAMMRRGGGMHTTTDFPGLLEDAARKNLRSAYEAAPQTWLPIASPVTLSDFKASRQLHARPGVPGEPVHPEARGCSRAASSRATRTSTVATASGAGGTLPYGRSRKAERDGRAPNLAADGTAA
jgi:hypothetical protein